MAKNLFLSLLVSLFVTPLAYGAEGSSQLKLDDVRQDSFSDMKVRLVPQLGLSSMAYTGKIGGSAGQGFTGGLTTELGSTKARLLETGLVFVQTNSEADVGTKGATETVTTSQIAIPLMAKIRFVDLKSQSWYIKGGVLTAFQTSSNHSAQTSTVDLLGALGVGARVPVSRTVDLVVEGTFNRGLLNAFLAETSVHEGLLFFTGLSIGL